MTSPVPAFTQAQIRFLTDRVLNHLFAPLWVLDGVLANGKAEADHVMRARGELLRIEHLIRNLKKEE